MKGIDLTGKLKRLSPRQRKIAQTALDWGYGADPINRRPVLWQGRTVLDIGMGGGPHCIPFILGGAARYIGVDPLVGSDRVRDKRSNSDPTIPTHHAFPFSVSQLMNAFPNVHLHSSLMEDASELIHRGILEHIERPDADTVLILSWTDAVLGKTMPRSPAQLYGQTFYVEDARRARILLDGRPLAVLAHNDPDETGRVSVTVAECEIETVIFNRLDPADDGDRQSTARNGVWRWQPAGNDKGASGRLSTKGGVARLDVELHGLTGEGAQHLAFDLCRDEEVAFGLVLATASGAEFFFGDEVLLAQLTPAPAAFYLFKQFDAAPGRWQTMVAPLHALTWRAGAALGGPLPSHALQKASLICAGPPGSAFDIGRLRLLRPRATALPRGRGYCVTGKVPGVVHGTEVHLVPAGGRQDAAATALVDQQGRFCFAGIEPGVYKIWAGSGRATQFGRRGLRVEVGPDIGNLVLDRRRPYLRWLWSLLRNGLVGRFRRGGRQAKAGPWRAGGHAIGAMSTESV